MRRCAATTAVSVAGRNVNYKAGENEMLKRRYAWTTLVAVLALGCLEGTGPAPAGPLAARKDAKTASDPSDPTSAPLILHFAPYAPPLETYDTCFAAVQGKASVHYIYFRDAFHTPYLRLEIPTDAQFVDSNGLPLSKGAKVSLCVRADSQYLQVELGPHGSTFGNKSGNPAILYLSYVYADLLEMAANGLLVWYQASSSDSWTALETEVDVLLFWVRTKIWHFSNYAVAYRR